MSKVRELPAYNPEWSDGCTLAPFIPVRWRSRFQKWVVKIIAARQDVATKMHDACVVHDLKYYYGGFEPTRLASDKTLRTHLKEAGASFWFRHAAYRAVRWWGGPHRRVQGVSWAYGGSYFQYGARALPLAEIVPPGGVQALQMQGGGA